MTRRMWIGWLVAPALAAGARGEDPPAKAAPTHPGLEKLKKLAGTWVEADKDGKPTDKVVSVVKVTAGGSAVQETLFPGQPMEMVSVYHLDKGDLVMTHYCVLGNQPRMKADPESPPNQIKWVFAGGTNLDPAKDTHMHGATVTFVDDDHIEIAGRGLGERQAVRDPLRVHEARPQEVAPYGDTLSPAKPGGEGNVRASLTFLTALSRPSVYQGRRAASASPPRVVP